MAFQQYRFINKRYCHNKKLITKPFVFSLFAAIGFLLFALFQIVILTGIQSLFNSTLKMTSTAFETVT